MMLNQQSFTLQAHSDSETGAYVHPFILLVGLDRRSDDRCERTLRSIGPFRERDVDGELIGPALHGRGDRVAGRVFEEHIDK